MNVRLFLRTIPLLALAIVAVALLGSGQAMAGAPSGETVSRSLPTGRGVLPQKTKTPPPMDGRTQLMPVQPYATPAACRVDDYAIVRATTASIDAGFADVGNHCDNCDTQLDLPFAFNLYDEYFTSASVSSNGVLRFAGGSTSAGNTCLPATSDSYAIYALWDDLTTDGPGLGVFTSVNGTSPNRTYVIEWRAATVASGGTANFALALYEQGGRFDLTYGPVTDQGAGATVGVQSTGGGRFSQFSCNTASISAYLRLKFTHLQADYTVSQSSGASIVPGTTDIGNHCDDCTSHINLPFPYTLYDTTFTSANVSSNGTLQFNSDIYPFFNTCLPDQNHSFTIFPHWFDMTTLRPGDGIFTSVTGTSPNRIFNIEWRACLYTPTGTCEGTVNFEVRLYEGQTRFSVVYGTLTKGGGGATVGVQRDMLNETQYACTTYSLYSGLALNFSLPGTGDYITGRSAGAGIVPGTTDTGNHCDECTTGIALPFSYRLYDQTYAGAAVDSNGVLQFSTSVPTGSNSCLPVPSLGYAIYPYWDNLTTACGGCGVFTSVTGTSPSRIFNVEWRAAHVSGGAAVNFEVRLYEGQTRFDTVYGAGSDGSGGASIGVQSGSGGGYTALSCNVASVAPGDMVAYYLPDCSPVPLLTGHVIWQGRPSSTPTTWNLPITLTLKSGTLERNFSTQTTDTGGFFTVSVGILPSGSYSWRVKGPQFLANAGNLTLTGAPLTQYDFGTMRSGDCNDDNAVGLNDFIIVRASYGTRTGERGYDARADLDGNSTIGITDFILVKNNYGFSGPPPIQPRR